jgi:hypothetical protein
MSGNGHVVDGRAPRRVHTREQAPARGAISEAVRPDHAERGTIRFVRDLRDHLALPEPGRRKHVADHET